MRVKGLAEGVACGAFGNAWREDRAAHCVLHDGFVQMVAALLAGSPIDIGSRGGENPRPRPLAASGGKLVPKCTGEFDPSRPLGVIAIVLGPHALDVRCEIDKVVLVTKSPLRR